MPKIFISGETPAVEVKATAETELVETEIATEEKTEPAPRTASKSTPVPSEPKSGDRTIIDGKPCVWIPGFGWFKDEGGGSVRTTVGNPGADLTGNKVGQMGGINKQIGIMAGGTVAEDMYENGHKIGIMGSEESASHETTAPPAEQPVPTGDDIYIELQPPVTKDSTPPPCKPGEAPPNP